MALPLSITMIKIHPAIGIARQSPNEDYFIFGQPPATYKSNNLIKRQAVQFTLVGYAQNAQGEAVEVEQLTPEKLSDYGLHAVWSAAVANRKVEIQYSGDSNHRIKAQATSDQNSGQLVGTLAGFDEGDQISLGQITQNGLFLPPIARVVKKDASKPISNSSMHSKDEADNTCDGKISAALYDGNNAVVAIPILPAWIIVAPPDFAPDALDPDVYPGRQTLEQYLVNALGRGGAQPLNTTARDREMLRHATGSFAPGIEASMGYLYPDEYFYASSDTGDDADIRVRPHDGSRGAQPGELTQGLCSPWQFDFVACTCSWWAAHRPDKIFQAQGSSQEVHWLRKRMNDTAASEDHLGPHTDLVITNPEMVEHVHELGIVRGETDRYETERTHDIP